VPQGLNRSLWEWADVTGGCDVATQGFLEHDASKSHRRFAGIFHDHVTNPVRGSN